MNKIFQGFQQLQIPQEYSQLQQVYIIISTDKDVPLSVENIKFFPLITTNLNDALKQYTTLVAPNKEIVGFYPLKFLLDQIHSISILAEENNIEFNELLLNANKF